MQYKQKKQNKTINEAQMIRTNECRKSVFKKKMMTLSQKILYRNLHLFPSRVKFRVKSWVSSKMIEILFLLSSFLYSISKLHLSKSRFLESKVIVHDHCKGMHMKILYVWKLARNAPCFLVYRDFCFWNVK